MLWEAGTASLAAAGLPAPPVEPQALRPTTLTNTTARQAVVTPIFCLATALADQLRARRARLEHGSSRAPAASAG
jgi:hypothetical protein